MKTGGIAIAAKRQNSNGLFEMATFEVQFMTMDKSKTKRFNMEMRRLADRKNKADTARTEPVSLWTEADFSPTQLLKHLDSNPIGQLLQLIAALPEVRYDKIAKARRELSMSEEQLNARLDVALDRMFEELSVPHE